MMQQLAKLDLRELRLLLLGGGAIIIALIASLLVIPKAKALYSASHEKRGLERTVQDHDALSQQLDSEYTTIQAIEKKLDGDMANFPARQVEAYVIGRLQSVSWENRIELVSVEPGTGERFQTFQEMIFDVRLTGEYDDLYRWLLAMREELGFIVIKEYQLKRNDEVDQGPQLMAVLSLASYRPVE